METKSIGAEIRAVDSEKREAVFVASTYDRDRHGTVVNQKGWQLENFNSNGVIGYQHNVYGGGLCEKATPDDIIGKGQAWVEGDALMVRVTFKPEGRSELADKVFLDVKDGFLKTVSVGFLELGEGKYGKMNEKGEVVDKETYFFEGQELLEISVVNIPSNPKALKKQFRDSTAFALSYLTKALDKRFSEIEEMRVRDILDLLNGKDIKSHDHKTDDNKRNAESDDQKNGNESIKKYNEFQIKRFETEKREREK